MGLHSPFLHRTRSGGNVVCPCTTAAARHADKLAKQELTVGASMYLNASFTMLCLFATLGFISLRNAIVFADEGRYNNALETGGDPLDIFSTIHSIADYTPATFTPVTLNACNGRGFAATTCQLGGWGVAPLNAPARANPAGDYACGRVPSGLSLPLAAASSLLDPLGLGVNLCLNASVTCQCFPQWTGPSCATPSGVPPNPALVLSRHLSPYWTPATPNDPLFNETFLGWCTPTAQQLANASARTPLAESRSASACGGRGACVLRPFTGSRNFTYSFCNCDEGFVGTQCQTPLGSLSTSYGALDMSMVLPGASSSTACTPGAVPVLTRNIYLFSLQPSRCGPHGTALELPVNSSTGQFTLASSHYRPQTQYVCACEPGFTGEQCLGGLSIAGFGGVSSVACAASIVLMLGSLTLYKMRKTVDARFNATHVTPGDFTVLVSGLPELVGEGGIKALAAHLEEAGWGPVHSIGPAFNDKMLKWWQCKLNGALRLELVLAQLQAATQGVPLPWKVHSVAAAEAEAEAEAEAAGAVGSHSHRDWELRMAGHLPPLPPGSAPLSFFWTRVLALPVVNDLLGMHRPTLARYIHGLQARIQAELASPRVRTFSRAFVTFESDASAKGLLAEAKDRGSQRCCCRQLAERGRGVEKRAPLAFQGHRLAITKAPEPLEVIWESMDLLPRERSLRTVASVLFLALFLLGLFIALQLLPTSDSGAVGIACSILVTSLNIASAYLWWAVATYWEQQETEGAKMRSVFFKTLLTQLTIAVASNVGVSGLPLDGKNGFLTDFFVGQSGFVMRNVITEALLPPLLSLTALGWRAFLVLYANSPSKDLQEWVKEAPPFLLAERSASFMRIIVIACAFGSGMPLQYLFAALCLLSNFAVDRYVLTYIYQNSPAGAELPRAVEVVLSVGSAVNVTVSWLTLRDGSSDATLIRIALFLVLATLVWTAMGYVSRKRWRGRDCFCGLGLCWTGGLCCYSRWVMAPVEIVNSLFMRLTLGEAFFLSREEMLERSLAAMRSKSGAGGGGGGEAAGAVAGASKVAASEPSSAGKAAAGAVQSSAAEGSSSGSVPSSPQVENVASETGDETGGRTYGQLSRDTPLWELQDHPYVPWERAQLGTHLSRAEVHPTMPPLTACQMADMKAALLDTATHGELPQWLAKELRKGMTQWGAVV